MENASKALIIAGSILLSILLIALAMYIFGQANGATDTSQLSALEVSAFNGKFNKFVGTKTGAQVSSLIDTLIANARENDSKSNRPTVILSSELAVTVGTASNQTEIKGSDQGSSAASVNDYIKALKEVQNNLLPTHRYKISTETSDNSDLIEKVTIDYNL